MPENELPPPIEQASLLNLRTIGGDDDAFVAEIIQMFREDTPPHFAELGDCVAKGDAFRLGKVAHSMKGSAGNFGAKHFRHLAEGLEILAKSGNLTEAPAAIAALLTEYERVLTALDAYTKPAG
jgi:HPt (histidine-containing phosphotransfer) domain-containing protein